MEETLEKMQEQVFLRRPILREILAEHGKEILADYVQKSWQVPSVSPDPLFLEVFRQEMEKNYPSDLVKKAVSQLLRHPLVSTVDHHGIWNHPIFVNSDLIYSLHFQPDQLAIALSTESVSLNNTSSWSGSLLYHQGSKLSRYSFFPDRLKHLPVFSTPAINNLDLERFKGKTKGGLGLLLDKLNIEKVLSLESFSQQASTLTSEFWKSIFPSAPQLVYMALESLVLNYLVKIFQQPEDFLSQLILTSNGREVWKKYFPDEHTFLFWSIDEQGCRAAMSKLPENNGELISLIKSKKVYPSSPLCFAVLLKAGLACAGGFTQTTWLSHFKDKFIRLLSELDIPHNISQVPTKNFSESSLASLQVGDSLITPTAVDLFLAGQDFYPTYLASAKDITLQKSFELALPTIYEVVVPKKT